MKLNSIKNLFEYKDHSLEQVDKILLKNIDKLQGLGLPDICVITKKLSRSILHHHQEQISSFHLVQGLCPQSQAEVLAYIQNLLLNQEINDQKNVFSINCTISKISYYIYDVFTRTILVCQFELFENGQSKTKIFGTQPQQQYILLTKQHWEGAYISNILRALDSDFKIPNVGRFFNNINLQNDRKLTQVISKMLKQISHSSENYQNLEVIRQKDEFPDLDEIIYYLNWPIYIIYKHLLKTSQLNILLNCLDDLEDNLLFYIIKSVLYYKTKNYEKSLELLASPLMANNKLHLIKFIFSKVLIKLKKFDQAFLVLKEILIQGYSNQIVWLNMAKIFRKLKNYQMTFYLLNHASNYHKKQCALREWNEVNLKNYRLISQNENLTDVNDLDQLFQIIYPIIANQLESFNQLSSHPTLEKILLRQRKLDKKDLKNKRKSLSRCMQNTSTKVNDITLDVVQKYEFFEKHELHLIKKETIKLVHVLGCDQTKKYLLLYFYHEMLSHQQELSQDIDLMQFQIKLKKDIKQKYQEQQNQNKSMVDFICESDTDEDEQPDFLKKNLNRTFDFSTSSLTNCQTPQSKLSYSPVKQIQKQKPKQQISKTYSVIQENAFESLESERNMVALKGLAKSMHFREVGKIPIAPESQPQINMKVKLYGWQDYFSLNLEEKKVFEDQIKRRKEIINPKLQEIFENIISVTKELEYLFYPQNQKQNKSYNESQVISVDQSPKQQQKILFKSQLTQSLKTKQHLQKPIEIREFYITHSSQYDEIDEKAYDHIIKIESIFLFKVVRIAIQLKKKELAYQILQKINQNIISVQISQIIFDLIFDNHIPLIQALEKILLDFETCGISQVSFVPIWMENYIIKLTKQMGSNYVLGLLTTLDNGQIFKMLKQIILKTEDLF